MMEINKKDLKKISYDFRCIANRLLNSDYNTAMSILKMFLNHIESTPLIFDFINSKINELEEDYTECKGAVFSSLGDTPDEEIAFVYGYLKYGSENFNNYYHDFAFRYGGKGSESIKNFNNAVALPFINHIEAYLTRIGIEMGYDEDVKYVITVNGGQVNIAKDQSKIYATQNNGANSDELVKMVESIKKLLDNTILNEEREIIEDNIEAIQEELDRDEPKKGLIKTCLQGLKTAITNIPTAIELCNNVEQFINFVMTKIPQ